MTGTRTLDGTQGSVADGTRASGVPAHIRQAIRSTGMASATPTDSLVRLAALALSYVAAAAAAMVLSHPVTWVLFWLYGGLVLASLFAAEHEAIHGSLFHRTWANHLAGAVTGALCANPYSAYRCYHLQHHSHKHAEGDTEPIVVLRSRLALVTIFPLAVVGLTAELWWQYARSVVNRTAAWSRRTRRPALDLLTAGVALAFAAICVAVGVTTGWWTVVSLWVLPLAAFFVWAAVFSTPEHYECDYGPAPVYDTSRTVLTNAAARWFVWNANYHAAHHLVPSVPGHHLPELQELIADDCNVVERSYWAYHSGLFRRIGQGVIPEEAPWTARVVDLRDTVDLRASVDVRNEPAPDGDRVLERSGSDGTSS